MKTKEISTLRTKEIGELKKMVKELREELASARLEHSMYKLKNTRSLFNKRKELAVIETIIKEKEMEQNG